MDDSLIPGEPFNDNHAKLQLQRLEALSVALGNFIDQYNRERQALLHLAQALSSESLTSIQNQAINLSGVVMPWANAGANLVDTARIYVDAERQRFHLLMEARRRLADGARVVEITEGKEP